MIRGTIYAAAGQVRVNGSSGTLTIDQVIVDEFLVNGAPGSQILVAEREKEFIAELRATGLVE